MDPTRLAFALYAAEDDALDALGRATTALHQTSSPPTKAVQTKLVHYVSALQSMVDAANQSNTKVRVPRAAASDVDAMKHMKRAAEALQRVGTTRFTRKDDVARAVQELHRLVDGLQAQPKANGTTRKTKKPDEAIPAVQTLSLKDVPLPPPALPPVVPAATTSKIDSTPHPEYTLDDEQDTPLNVLDPDDDGSYEWDEFDILDHLANFVYQDDYASDEDAAWAYDDELDNANADGAYGGLDGYVSDGDDGEDDPYYSDD
ncbi:hypothetical protein EXIGLDRAFT_839658 [Exidia glandulosa HHB12029]|uniref:Uncharacterized protein n=1 Tax=Exidia glandulosa HHB12029 TaxID=1314781 RepID=A0A165EW77_EXIGL|nr:hypothetical protein EXIGLDRAFT_839658 [Exidia glandulosa HHB12029]